MTQLHERETQDLKLTETIEPAQGKEKERLEAECAEYLQNPNKAQVADLLRFTSNMIMLIGGESHKRRNIRVTFTSSNPILDEETQTSIVFKTDRSKMMDIVCIIATSADRTEGLGVWLMYGKETQPYSKFVKSHIARPPFLSYITGEEEPEKPISEESDHVEPNVAKSFAQKVFAVYQRQGQQPQPSPL